MKKASVIIGMNYGDEGKGHITNFLSSHETLNVRFNGGAQAAHTVVLADGRSHVFRHFGSGSLKGARTLLSKHFLLNPLLFIKELETLLKMKAPIREILIDPRCTVTTPYDMLINEFSSKHRNKKDTCGAGINETVTRSLHPELKITARDLAEKSDSQISEILKTIENQWIPYRLNKLGIPESDFKYFAKDFIIGDDFEKNFIFYAKKMMSHSAMFSEEQVIDKFLAKGLTRNIVFEGAQGMLLDEDRKIFFPWVTRSKTGIDNVVDILDLVKTELDIEVLLVTRSYLSRHGDGPIFNSLADKPYAKVEDPTNPENRFQGSIRYGLLNQRWYQEAFEEICECSIPIAISKKHKVNVDVAMTCIDQLDEYEASDPLNSIIKFTKMPNTKMEDEPIGLAFNNISIISTGRKESDIRRI